MLPVAARELARQYLAEALPRRWTHVCAVAAKAEVVAVDLGLPSNVLVSAAWLHDIGYAPGIAVTGFHPLDGGRFLRANDVDERIVGLVAHHSCAVVEADERGLGLDLRAEFVHEPGLLSDALWFCDMTTGPDGQDLAADERLAEIRCRYGPEHVVSWFINRAEGEIQAAVLRTEQRLGSRAGSH
jgi:hypothetical protein